jgi:hypothetical protein
MRVILSAAYCNQKRSESAVDLGDDFENHSSPIHPSDSLVEEEEENESSNSSDSSSRPESPSKQQQQQQQQLRLRLLASEVSTPDSSPHSETNNNSELERKLPATKSEEASRKRKLPLIESQGNHKKPAADIHNDSKKPAAKMTAGCYADDERDPPPCQGENAISWIDHNPVEEDAPSSQSSPSPSQQDFCKALKERGLEIRQQEGDGNCLFRAVSLQVYGDPSMHMDVRKQSLDHMAKDEEHFAQFVEDEEFSSYLKRKRQEGVHGNNPEIQAISELFNRPVEVFTLDNGATPLNIFQSEYKTSDVPIRLSYQDNHYDAVVDPLLPTAGLGLGLPGLQPGLADKLQMEKAVRESDQMADQAELKQALDESHNDELQRAIKESCLSVDQLYNTKALAMSDLEATNFDLEQAVSTKSAKFHFFLLHTNHLTFYTQVLESSMEAFRQHESERKHGAADKRSRREPPSPVASIPPAAAPTYAAAAAAAASVPEEASAFPTANSTDEYPSTVQELVMNGFELSKVIHAYELIGDNFDDLLSFLVSTST